MQRPPYGLCLPCRLVRVIDGDTVVISLPGSHREWPIRLVDCWAPELRTSAGKRARDFLAGKLSGRELAVFVPCPADPLHLLRDMVSFERVLGRLFLDGQDVSELMVAGGLATADRPRGNRQ